LPEEEVATVRKSLEQLKQIELLPFYAVTGNAPSQAATVDGLLASHIRYQGFQGNIRATTRPVSFDPQAFTQLMSLPEFATWRENGGLMISDNLGSRAFRRFIDPSGEIFNARFIARDAFLTGNDILYVGNDFISPGDPSSYISILRTLAFFAQKYREDPAFAQRVDISVFRILTLKYKIYENIFTLDQVLAPEDSISDLGTYDQVTFDVAQEAATIINPSLEELDETLAQRIAQGGDHLDLRRAEGNSLVGIVVVRDAVLVQVRFAFEVHARSDPEPVVEVIPEDAVHRIVGAALELDEGGHHDLAAFGLEDVDDDLPRPVHQRVARGRVAPPRPGPLEERGV